MTFLAPVWLLALAPWMGVAVWLMQRRRRPTEIPFLALWNGPIHPPKPAKQFAVPPASIFLLLLAMLLGILGAAQPHFFERRGVSLTIIVDRGASMSAGAPRFVEAAAALARRIGAVSSVTLITLPGGAHINTDQADWPIEVQSLKKTAVQTRDTLSATVASRLRESDEPVVVISDQVLDIQNDRLIQIPPAGRFANVGIAHIAAREGASPQLMLRIDGQSPADQIQVRVKTGSSDVQRQVTHVPQTLFIDVPSFGQTIQAMLDVNDDAQADNWAGLVRQGEWPRIEVGAELSEALNRLVESYTKARPPTQDAPAVRIVNTVPEAANATALVVPRRMMGDVVAGELITSSHAVTEHVDFARLDATSDSSAAPAGWAPILRRGGVVLAAVRESPARQVWVGFSADSWSATPDFVIFFTNIFDWLGQGRTFFTAGKVADLGATWRPLQPAGAKGDIDQSLWPGMFQDASGRIRAVNSGLVSPGGAVEKGNLSLLQSLHPADAGQLPRRLLMAALVCVCLSAALWNRRTLTDFSGKTTVPADGG